MPAEVAMENTANRKTGGGGGGSMKKKLAELEVGKSEQDSQIAEVTDRINNIESIVGPGGAGLSKVVKEHLSVTELKIMNHLATMQDEMDHKFSLQVAENKRVTQHLSNIKRENQALTKRLVAAEERVANLELELGDEMEDE